MSEPCGCVQVGLRLGDDGVSRPLVAHCPRHSEAHVAELEMREYVLRHRIEVWMRWFEESQRGHFAGRSVAIRLKNALEAVVSQDEARAALRGGKG